jgi:hypothetical protein
MVFGKQKMIICTKTSTADNLVMNAKCFVDGTIGAYHTSSTHGIEAKVGTAQTD